MGRSPLRLGFFLAALAVACLALMPFAQSAQAAEENNALLEDNTAEENNALLEDNTAEEDNALLEDNMAEENDAVAEPGSDTVEAAEAAMGQAADNPNKRVIPIIIEKNLQCAGGKVILKGDLVVSFKDFGSPFNGARVRPNALKLVRFKGTAVSGRRKLVAKDLRLIGRFRPLNGRPGFFGFNVQFVVTGRELPGGSPLRFAVRYDGNLYKYKDGKVTHWVPDKKPTFKCL
jgi:hypothetical protein